MIISSVSKRFSVVVVVLAAVLTTFSAFGLTAPAFASSDLHKHPEHPYIGVQISAKDTAATIVSIMPNSPADKAGLKKGDIITAVDGAKVTAADISQKITALQVGKAVKLSIMRDSKAMDITITLADMPVDTYWVAADDTTVLVYHPTQTNWQLISLSADSALAKAGFKAGDLIKTFDGKAYTSDTLATYVTGLKKTAMVTIAVDRRGKTQDIKVSAADLAKLTASPVAFYQDELMRSRQLAITYLPLTADLAKDYGVSVNDGFLVVTASEAEQKAGLKLMDVITAVNDTKITTPASFDDALAKLKLGDTVTLAINRAGKTDKVELKLSNMQNTLKSTLGALAQLFHAHF